MTDDRLAIAMQHHQSGQLPEAERLYHAVLAQQPGQAKVLYLLGLLAHQQGQLDAAIAWYQQAVAAQPASVEAHNNLGAAFQQQGNLTAAIAHYQAVLRLQPQTPNANVNLGVALQQQGKLDAAIARYHKAIALNPALPEAYTNLGHALKEQGQFEQAIVHYQKALELMPQPEAYRTLADALLEQNQVTAAIALYDQALTLDPHNIRLQGSRLRATLITGDLKAGFAAYDPWRLARSGRSFTQPTWDGGPLNGNPILLFTEPGAGFGDILQVVRYVPLVAQSGGQIILECPPPLQRLLQSITGIKTLITTDTPPPTFAVQASLLSLPRIFGTSLETIPAKLYLQAPTATWQLPVADITDDTAMDADDRLPLATPALKVGLVWGGDPNHLNDQERSCPLQEYKAFLNTPGVIFYSLQKGPHAIALANLKNSTILDVSDRLHDFADTATAIAQLDLVISVDTAVAHLAGALGKPVWVLLAFAADWRWLLHRRDSPWYPTAQLFRQPRPRDWTAVCAQVARALNNWMTSQ